MADGYIGKISAVVTANTSDLERKLNQGRDAVDKFANGLGVSMRSAATSAAGSFEKIFTPLQQLERRLQMAQKLNLRFDIPGVKDVDASKLRGLVSIAEQINKPMEVSAKRLAALPLEMQAGFLPAFKSVQDKVELVNRAFQETGKIGASNFAMVERMAQQAAAAIARLTEADKAVGSLLSGQELGVRRPDVAAALGSARAAQDRIMESGSASGSSFVTSIYEEARKVASALAEAESEETKLKGKTEETNAALKKRLEILLKVVEASNKESQSASLATANSRLTILSPQDVARDRAAAQVRESVQRRSDLAASFRTSFGGAGQGGVLFGIQQNAIQGYTAQLQLLQNAIGRVAGSARGPAVQAFNNLRAAIAAALESGTLGTAATQRRIDLLMRTATREAAQAGGISQGRLTRQLARTGDIARGVGGNAGLAAQQLIFAFDDIISVTGGLDQRIRAAGNNISQFGFLLGGTAGLITGVVVSALAQGGAWLYRWATRADEAESATKRMNKALEAQRSQTEELADSYKKLAASIASAGLSDRDRTQREKRQAVNDIVEQQRQRVRTVAEANLPTVGASQARIDAIDKQLQNEVNIVQRRRLIGERNRLTRGIDANIANTVQQGTQIANTALRFQGNNAVQALQTGYLGLRFSQQQLVRAQNSGDRQGVAEWSRQVAALTVAIQLLKDTAIVGAFQRQQSIADTLARAQNEMQNVQGFRLSDTMARRTSDILQNDVDRLVAGDITAQEFQQILQARLAETAAIEKASYQVAAFSDAMANASGNISKAVESELTQRAESLRREANAAEARFGAGDPRTAILRQQQADVEAARRTATENRQSIDATIARQRLDFEAQALRGVGNPQAAAIAARIQELDRIINAQAPTGPRAEAFVMRQELARVEADRLRQELRDLFDALPDTQALRRRADEGDVAAQRQIQQLESVARGMELSMSPAERAGADLAQKIEDIRNYADKAAEASSGLPEDVAKIRDRASSAIARITDETFRQVAPAIAGLYDSVQNSILSGPSRAALNVSDVSTVEGARELNRLLRGEDPAKDQNLVELRKQSQQLGELVQIARDRGVIPVANN